MKRTFFLAPILLLAFASSARSADTTDRCAVQKKAWQTAVGATEQARALEIWNACEAWVKEQGKVDLVATRDAWAQSLDKLPNGGWTLLTVSDDGTFAVFGSLRHATREGNVVAVSQRWEYREQQNDNSRSYVVREMYDCAQAASKSVSSNSYRQSNLSGEASSKIYDEKWVPVAPGTLGESLLDWACKTVPQSQAAKAR